MEFIDESKVQELSLALQNRNNLIIIVSGPSGSLKSYLINYVLSKMSLVSEYIEDIANYKSKLLTKSSICLTDIDDMDFFIKNKLKISSMSNLIIETRSLPYIYKSFTNSVSINLRKISSTLIKKYYKFTDDILNVINGNMHRIDFYKYTIGISNNTIYNYLNNLYRSYENIKIPNDHKIIKYLFSNSLYYVDISSLYEIHELISLTDYKLDEFCLCSINLVKNCKKNKLEKFLSMKSWVYDDHNFCNGLCKSYKDIH